MLGWTELLIIFGILVLLFGASRIPGVARSLGESINEFRSALDTGEDQTEDEKLNESNEQETEDSPKS